MSMQVPDGQEPANEGRQAVVELNGQQEALLQRLVAEDPHGRTAEQFIRDGFIDFFKKYRQKLS